MHWISFGLGIAVGMAGALFTAVFLYRAIEAEGLRGIWK